jgi:hypothetical protein
MNPIPILLHCPMCGKPMTGLKTGPMEPGPTLITGLPVCDACYYPADTTLADLTTPPVPTCQRCYGAAASRLVKETTRCSFRRTNSPALEQCEREMGHAGSCQNGNASWFT